MWAPAGGSGGSGHAGTGGVTQAGAGTTVAEALDGSGQTVFVVGGLARGPRQLALDYPGAERIAKADV